VTFGRKIVVDAFEHGQTASRPTLRVGPAELALGRAPRPRIVLHAESVRAGRRERVKICIEPAAFGRPLRVEIDDVPVEPVIDTTTRWLFRGDGRAPEVIFEHGFQPKGENDDLRVHAGTCESSIFVPTSRSASVARGFGGGAIYLVENDQLSGVDLQATFRRAGKHNPFPHEQEVAFFDGISAQHVVLARPRGGVVTTNPRRAPPPPEVLSLL
jgi:hypothetical protein